MVILVTGGAGFIGRWVVKKLLDENKEIVIIDNLDNGNEQNVEEFKGNSNLKGFYIDDVQNEETLRNLFLTFKFTICIHLAAQVNVQESLDNPRKAFDNNVIGTFNLLEQCVKYKTKVILIGTCLVYDLAGSDKAISETHPIKSTSPYAASKIAAEELALSYFYGLGLPVVILRPFNTYGPYQKFNTEGGVVSIFVNRKLNGQSLLVYGDGSQTRDFLYVEDCAEFIVKASECEKCVGEIINAGTGRDISINELAKLIIKDEELIKHIPHHHPQSEIMKLVCNNSKAVNLLKWYPKTSLEDGILLLEKWIKEKGIES